MCVLCRFFLFMLVKTGQNITEIEGKSGGDIYRTDVCGQHIQSYPREVDSPITPAQEARRKAFRTLTNYFKSHATVEFAARWQIYADSHTKTNKKGEVIRLTWWQQFIAYNINRVVAGEPIIEFPP